MCHHRNSNKIKQVNNKRATGRSRAVEGERMEEKVWAISIMNWKTSLLTARSYLSFSTRVCKKYRKKISTHFFFFLISSSLSTSSWSGRKRNNFFLWRKIKNTFASIRIIHNHLHLKMNDGVIIICAASSYWR